MSKTIFELEEGIMYHCNFYGDSVTFKRDNNKLFSQMGNDWCEATTIHSSWRFTEIPAQRNLCPKCNVSMEFVPNVFHVQMFQWYSGFRCPQCREMYENKNDPHPKVIQGLK